jgi:hypothetical protein
LARSFLVLSVDFLANPQIKGVHLLFTYLLLLFWLIQVVVIVTAVVVSTRIGHIVRR